VGLGAGGGERGGGLDSGLTSRAFPSSHSAPDHHPPRAIAPPRGSCCEELGPAGAGPAGWPLHVSWLFLKAHWNRAPRRSAARGQGLHADSSRSLAFSLVEKLKSNVPTAFIPMDLENGDWHLATATQGKDEPCDHKPSLNGTESIRMHLRGQKLIPQIFVAWYVCDCLQPNMI